MKPLPRHQRRRKTQAVRGKAFCILTSCVLSLVSPLIIPIAHAQDLTTNACIDQTYKELHAAQRYFRGVVLGEPPAAMRSIGAIRYDRQRRGWIRTAANTWKAIASASAGTRTDAQIDAEAEFPPTVGIMETRKARTSDLIPHILQAFRAFQCETRAVCLTAIRSQTEGAPNVLHVQPPGCIAYNIPRFDACRLEQPPATAGSQMQRANITEFQIGACDEVRRALVEHEVQMLKLITAYDYRSFLQFVGTFDDFLMAFQQPLLLPIWQTVRMLEKLFEERTCFTAQCDE